jgi:hypothetical protein
MHKNKTAGKAARPCKSSAAQTSVTIQIPIALLPLLKACCSWLEQTPEAYTTAALLSFLKCDTDYLHDELRAIITKLERGQA